MRFIPSNLPSTNSYNLHIYSQLQSQGYEELIKSSELTLNSIVETSSNWPKSSDSALQLQLLMEHYDSFYAKSLKELKETPEKSEGILSNLKTILQYEYTLMKEVEFIEGPEDLSNLVQLLPHVQERNTINLLLRIIAEKARNAKYPEDSNQHSLYWQLKLSRFVQPLYEFISEINFDDFLNGSLDSNYQENLQSSLRNVLSQKVDAIVGQQNTFVELRDKLKNISDDSNALSENVIAELHKAFTQGIVSKKELNPDIYEVSSLLLLIVLVRNYFSNKDTDLLSFFVTIENVRASINSIKTPIPLQKLIGKPQKWKQIAVKSLEELIEKGTASKVPLQYLFLLNDLASTQRFLLIKSRKNDKIYIVNALDTIVANAKELSNTKAFSVKTSNQLDEALIEYVNILRRCIFLSYDPHNLQIAQELIKVLFETSLVNKIDTLTLKKIERLSSDILRSDKQFIPALLNTGDDSSPIKRAVQSLEQLVNKGSETSSSAADAAVAILRYLANVLTVLRQEDHKDLLEALKTQNFGQAVLTVFQQAKGKELVKQNKELNNQILLFTIQYNQKSQSLGLEQIAQNLIPNPEEISLSDEKLSANSANTLTVKLLSQAFETDSLVSKSDKATEAALSHFFSVSILDNVSSNEVIKALSLSPEPAQEENNRRKIRAITNVLKNYQGQVQTALKSIGEDTESQQKLTNLATELVLGPLRVSQLMLKPLYQNTEKSVKKVLEQCTELAEIVSSLVVSPLLLFTSEQFELPDQETKDISKRIPYLHALSSLLEVNYFDRITKEIASVTSAWSSDVKIASLEKLLRLVKVNTKEDSKLAEYISLTDNVKERETLTSKEYSLLNVLHLLSSLKAHVVANNGNIVTLASTQEDERIKSQQEVEKVLSPFVQLLNQFFEGVFTGIDALKTQGKNPQNKKDGLPAKKNVLLNEWLVVLRSTWLGLTSLLAFYNSKELYVNGTVIVFEDLIKHFSSRDLPTAVREQFIAAFCEVPSVSQLFKRTVLSSKPKLNYHTVAVFLQTVDNSLLKKKMQELDTVTTVNSFIKKTAQEASHPLLKHVQESIKDFYRFLYQNNSIRLNVEKLANDVNEIQDLEANILQKDLRSFVEDVVKYIRDVILSQLTRTVPKVGPSSSDWEDQKKGLIALLKDIQGQKFSEDSSLASTLVSSLVKSYNSISQQARELLDWSQLETEDYPVSEEILLQAVQSFKTLASELTIEESDAPESDLITELADLLENILYDLRASLSYYFLQGKKDTKQLQQSLISFISESILDSIAKNKSISGLLDRESTVKNLWTALYNLVLVNPSAMDNVVQQGLLAKLLNQEYPAATRWYNSSGLAIFLFERTMQTSLPLKDLVELSLKKDFIIFSSFKEELVSLLSSRFLTMMGEYVSNKDLHKVLSLFKLPNEGEGVYIEVNPPSLDILQAPSLDSSEIKQHEEQTLVESLLQRLSSEARQLLDTLILASIKNYVHATVQSLKETPKRRRLTVEILQYLQYLSVKYIHTASYIFLQQIDTQILRDLGLPNQYPYSKLFKGETFSFLDFILRVALKQDKVDVFPILDFVDTNGVPAQVVPIENDSYRVVDFNTVLFNTVLQLVDDIIDEHTNADQLHQSLDSIELIKTIISLIKHYLAIDGKMPYAERTKLAGPTVRKLINLLLPSLGSASQNVYGSSDITSAVYLLSKQLEYGPKGSLSDARNYNYLDLIKAYNGSNPAIEKDPESDRSKQIVDNLLAKRKGDLSLKEVHKKSEATSSAKKEPVRTPEELLRSKKLVYGLIKEDAATRDGTEYFADSSHGRNIRNQKYAEYKELQPVQADFEMYCFYSGQECPSRYADTSDLMLSTQPRTPALSLGGKNYLKIAENFSSEEDKPLYERYNESANVAVDQPASTEQTGEQGADKDAEKEVLYRTLLEELTPEILSENFVQVVTSEIEKYTDFAQTVFESDFLNQMNACADSFAAFTLLRNIVNEKLKLKQREALLLKILGGAGFIEEENVEEEKAEGGNASPEVELFRKRRRLFNDLVRPAFGNIQIKESKLTQKNVKRYWFKHLTETRRNIKNKLENVLLTLRRSLLEKSSLEKIGVKGLEEIVGPMDTLEHNYLIVALKKQAIEYVDESIKTKSTEVEPDLVCIEELINDEDGSLQVFLDKYIAHPTEPKKEVKQEESKEETKEGDGNVIEEPTEPKPEENEQSSPVEAPVEGQASSAIPSLTSLQGKQPPKFTLNSEVTFCQDKINFDELTIGQRQFADIAASEEQKITPEILRAFRNLIPCSDEQIEYLLKVLYTKSDSAKSWGTSNDTTQLYRSICQNPNNEIKLIDAILFLLLNPNIYKKEDLSGSKLLSKMVQSRVSIVQRKAEDIYSTFAENAIHFLKYYLHDAEPRIMYIPLDSFKPFTIKSIDELKSKYKYENKIDSMSSLLDLLILTAKVPEIVADKRLTQVLVDINQNFLKFAENFRNKDYVFEIAGRHIEYLFKQCGREETMACFQGNFKAFINIIPGILESLVTSLKEKSQKIVEIVAKLKEIEKSKEGDKKELLKPIEEAEEFKEISGIVVLLVSNFFNFLFRTSYLFWKSEDFKDLIDLDTFNLIKTTLKNVDEELQREESQMFILLVYEALDVYQRLAKGLKKLDSSIMNLTGIKPLVEMAISLYAIAEMNTRLQKEVTFDEDSSPLPKLSKMISKEYATEQPKKMQRSFTALKSDKSFDFNQIFSNFGLNYNPILSRYFQDLSNQANVNVIGGLVIFLTEKFPFIVTIDAKKKLIKKMYLEFFYQGSESYRRDLILDRERLTETFAENLVGLTREDLARGLNIRFVDESGIDQGGLTREFYTVIASELFDPSKGLFKSSGNDLSIQPRPDSMIIPNDLKMFELAGIFVAKAIIADNPIDCFLTKSFLKHCLGRKITIGDLAELDPNLSKSLKWTLENDITDAALTFTYETEILNQNVTKELIDGGFDVDVDESNKKEYVLKICEAMMTKEIEAQIGAFLKGFHAIIPRRFLSFLSPSDLGLIIAGTPTIDLEDMKKHCRYEYLRSDSDLAKWFWEIVSEFTQEQLGSLLFYVSGSTKVPVGGFKERPIVLRLYDHLTSESLPVAHTCFYTMDIPEYQTKEKFKEKLLLAMFEGNQGFYIA